MKHSKPLSSDAFSNMEGSTNKQSAIEVKEATELLHSKGM